MLTTKTRNLWRIVTDDGSPFYSRGGDNRTELAYQGDGRFRMLGIPVEVLVWFEPATVSASGMLVECSAEMPIGSHFRFRLHLPSERLLQGEAKVVRSTTPDREMVRGYGVRFRAVSSDGRQDLIGFLRSLRER